MNKTALRNEQWRGEAAMQRYSGTKANNRKGHFSTFSTTSFPFPTCLRAVAILTLATWLVGCNNNPAPATNSTSEAPAKPASGMDVAQITERNRKLNDSHDSVMKLRAKIHVENPAAQLTLIPPEVRMTLYTKQQASGGEIMLAQFTAPPTQKDLSALITVSQSGDVEGVRYNQSSNNFVSSRGVLSEDSLFGMTMQELIGGQPEKYDLKLIGEDTFNQTPVYRLDGKLKQGTESRFNRLVMFVAKDNFATVGAEFYDEHDQLMRRLTVDKQAQVGGHWTRMHWTVDNLSKQKKVEFETLDAKYDQNLSDTTFTRDQLKKVAAE